MAGHGLRALVFRGVAYDERGLGSSEFVQKLLFEAGEKEKQSLRLMSRIPDLASLAERIAKGEGVDEGSLRSGARKRPVSRARRLFCPQNLLLIIVFLVYGVNMFFPRFLWTQDEARYGEVVREMVTSGCYLVPTLDGEFYADKPPLYFWTLALQSGISGMNAFSFRLVTILSLLGFAAAFFVFARRLIGVNRAIWAVLIVLTSMLFVVAGNIVRMDLLMAAFVVLSLHYFMRAVDENDTRKSFQGYGLAILAVMVKGPLGLALPLLGAMTYAFLQDGKKGLGRLKLLHGLGLNFLVAGLWTGYLYFSGQNAYLENILTKQIFGRAVKSWSHPEPFYFYALMMPALLMPWLPFLWRGFRRAPKRVRRAALCWFLPGFILISVISGKLFIYLIPIFPAAALLIAAGLPAPWENGEWSLPRWQGLASGIFFIAFGGSLFYALFALLPEEAGHLAIVAVIPFLAGIGMVIFGLQRKGKRLLWLFLLASCLISWISLGWGSHQLNDYLSTRKLGLSIAEAVKAGYKPVAVDIARGTISFYAGTIMRNISHDELSDVLNEPGLVAVAIRDKRRHRISQEDMERLSVLARFPRLQFSGYTLYVEKGQMTVK